MGKTKSRGKYQAISLPKEYVKTVRKHVKKSKFYRSIAEFTKIAVEEKIRGENIKLESEFRELKEMVRRLERKLEELR